MKIYDISQEIFSCKVFPGDPIPQKETLQSMNNGSLCNLSSFKMCCHNGTHIDSPFHFINDGKTTNQISIERFVGFCYVAEHNGILSEEDAIHILQKAKAANSDSFKRILIKGKAEISVSAARIFAQEKIYLIGNES